MIFKTNLGSTYSVNAYLYSTHNTYYKSKPINTRLLILDDDNPGRWLADPFCHGWSLTPVELYIYFLETIITCRELAYMEMYYI